MSWNRTSTFARTLALGLGLSLASLGCGASAKPDARTPGVAARPLPPRKPGAPAIVPVKPLEVAVKPRRTGGALEVAITVVARGHGEGEAFEDPNGWVIEVQDARGGHLRRLMNGPARVVRAPVGREDGEQWDVTVRHSIFFELPPTVSEVAIHLEVPGAPPVQEKAEVPQAQAAAW